MPSYIVPFRERHRGGRPYSISVTPDALPEVLRVLARPS